MATARAFVTGATGLLGNNLVRELLDHGYTVRALARSCAMAELQFSGGGHKATLDHAFRD